MIRRPPRSTQSRSSAASDVYKRQGVTAGADGQIVARKAHPMAVDLGKHRHMVISMARCIMNGKIEAFPLEVFSVVKRACHLDRCRQHTADQLASRIFQDGAHIL